LRRHCVNELHAFLNSDSALILPDGSRKLRTLHSGDIMKRSLFVALAAVLLLPATTLAQSAQTVVPVAHASADDCEIIVAVGKAKLNWGAAPPAQAFFPESNREDGSPWVADCAWKKFGVADPVIGTPDSPSGFSLSPPVYDGNTASVDFQTFVAPPKGQHYAPFMSTDTCKLERRLRHWRLIECSVKLIT
jgi:hypothetical protein